MAAKKTSKARKQVSLPVGPKRPDKSSGNTYNIWYNKHAGERGHTKDKAQASTRCNVAKDSGQTKGSERDGTFLCVQFARGCCPLGYDCSWLHTLPSKEFEKKLNATRDCFGRERHDKVRDDQSGVGSFMAEDQTSRTLYVGGISVSPDIQKIVYDHFSEWGEIENVKVLQSKGVAFVRYRFRSNAEFAKEAMQNQPLDQSEILNVRWATDDPNPWVLKRKERESKEMLATAVIKAQLEIDQEQGNDYPTAKRPHRETALQGEAVGYYPDTDYQYERPHFNTSTSTGNHFEAIRQPETLSSGQSITSDVIQPKTLSDLVEWSKKQASVHSHQHIKQFVDKSNTEMLGFGRRECSLSSPPLLQPKKGSFEETKTGSLVPGYDSSSDDEKED